MEFPPNAFSPEQASYLDRVLRDLDLRGQGNTKAVNIANNGVTVTASSAVTIPDNCDYFVLSGTSPVATLSYKPPGYRLTIRLGVGTILTHSALSLLLKDDVDRVTFAEGIIELVSFGADITGAGMWREVGDNTPSVIDLTGYAGADLKLCVNQSSKYSLSAVTSLLLRIATATNQEYELNYASLLVPGSTIGTGCELQPNNANTGPSEVINQASYVGQTTPAGAIAVTNRLALTQGNTLVKFNTLISTKTDGKYATGTFTTRDATLWYGGYQSSVWSNLVALWISLGTLQFQNITSGLMRATRKL